MDLGIS